MITEEDKKELERKKEELLRHYINHLNKQKGENKMEKVKNALPVMKVNHKARASLVTALAYDEVSKRESYQRAYDYISRRELKAHTMPFWMWAIMYVIIGVLGVISADIIAQNWGVF